MEFCCVIDSFGALMFVLRNVLLMAVSALKGEVVAALFPIADKLKEVFGVLGAEIPTESSFFRVGIHFLI